MRLIAKTVVCATTTALALTGCLGREHHSNANATDSAPPSVTTAPEPNAPAAPADTAAADVRTFSSTSEKPSYTLITAPDFLNQDVGDVTGLPGWDPGEPNSWTAQLQTSIDVFLNEIAAQRPDSVLVTGDLVEGHWLRDVEDTGIFGAMDTAADKVAAIRRAGNFYHAQFLERFADRGLTLHAAVGDHDIGDNPWDGDSARQVFKREHVAVYKDLFSRHYTRTPNGSYRYASRPVGTPWEDTAYAVQLSPGLLLVSLDVFHVTEDDVVPEVVEGQLAWVRQVLKGAAERGTKWVVVQGHTPIVTPVRARSSSGMSLRHGTGSALWRMMARYGVDLYISGEVHDTTMRQADGITQISTGGLLYKGEASYMTAKVHRDRIDLDVREFDKTREPTGKMWQFGAWRTHGGTTMFPGSHSVGTLTLRANHRTTNAAGKLASYLP